MLLEGSLPLEEQLAQAQSNNRHLSTAQTTDTDNVTALTKKI
jgi:hypothetical protein